jgi:hypothetical protein
VVQRRRAARRKPATDPVAERFYGRIAGLRRTATAGRRSRAIRVGQAWPILPTVLHGTESTDDPIGWRPALQGGPDRTVGDDYSALGHGAAGRVHGPSGQGRCGLPFHPLCPRRANATGSQDLCIDGRRSPAAGRDVPQRDRGRCGLGLRRWDDLDRQSGPTQFHAARLCTP